MKLRRSMKQLKLWDPVVLRTGTWLFISSLPQQTSHMWENLRLRLTGQAQVTNFLYMIMRLNKTQKFGILQVGGNIHCQNHWLSAL